MRLLIEIPLRRNKFSPWSALIDRGASDSTPVVSAVKARRSGRSYCDYSRRDKRGESVHGLLGVHEPDQSVRRNGIHLDKSSSPLLKCCKELDHDTPWGTARVG